MSAVVETLGRAGTGITELVAVDGAVDAAGSLADGDWVAAGVEGVGAGLDVLGMILDPIATAGAVVGHWILEHCDALQRWLDELLGRPDVIEAASRAWEQVADRLAALAPDYRAAVTHEVGELGGLTAEAYRGLSGGLADFVESLSAVTRGVGGGVLLAGAVLAGVRQTVLDLVADLIGRAIDAVAKSVLTLGVAAPAALAGLISTARSVVERCRRLVKALAESLEAMADLIRRLSPALETATRFLATVVREGPDLSTRFALTVGDNLLAPQ